MSAALGGRRRWSVNSEARFRNLLIDVAVNKKLQFKEFALTTLTSFEDQIQFFADAAIIIRFHGAGLALTAFAPPGATLIEIEPDYRRLDLFGNLRSSNILYQRVLLEPGTMDKTAPNCASHLIDTDARSSLSSD